jgi:hypothetical protein
MSVSDQSVSEQFGEALKLAELVSEKTGISIGEALEMLSNAARGRVVVDVAPANPMPEPTLRPFDIFRFRARLDRIKPGSSRTAIEICVEAGMGFPANSKGPSFAMRAAGWIDTGGRRDGFHVYLKPDASVSSSRTG